MCAAGGERYELQQPSTAASWWGRESNIVLIRTCSARAWAPIQRSSRLYGLEVRDANVVSIWEDSAYSGTVKRAVAAFIKSFAARAAGDLSESTYWEDDMVALTKVRGIPTSMALRRIGDQLYSIVQGDKGHRDEPAEDGFLGFNIDRFSHCFAPACFSLQCLRVSFRCRRLTCHVGTPGTWSEDFRSKAFAQGRRDRGTRRSTDTDGVI